MGILDVNQIQNDINNAWVPREEYDKLNAHLETLKGIYVNNRVFLDEICHYFLGPEHELAKESTIPNMAIDQHQYFLNVIKSHYKGYRKPFKSWLKETFTTKWSYNHDTFNIGGWYTGYKTKKFEITYSECGYEDGHG